MDYLPQDMKSNMSELLEYLKGLRMTPHWYATNSFNVKFKGRIVFRYNISKKGTICIFFTVADVKDLDEVLSALPDDMQEFYFNNLRLCTGCNPAHGNGRKVIIMSKEYRVCAEPEMKITNPTKEHINYLKKFVSVRRENISAS